ncbi:hypothetical protein [Microbacterium sp.]|uniref:hypothetical protein n=1 Tax=Microbacterium sp. TaxID=51671 RepID=UPI0039E4F383
MTGDTVNGIGNLFGDAPAEERQRQRELPPIDAAAVRMLFGDAEPPAAASTSVEPEQNPLFDDVRADLQAAEAYVAGTVSVDALFGAESRAAAAVVVEPPRSTPSAAPPERRGKTSRWLVIVSAVAAVTLVAGGVALAFVLAPPSTDEAVAALEDQERTVSGQVERLNAAIATLTTTRDAELATAQAFAQPLVAMTAASDEAARAGAENARLAYIAALEQIEVPATVPAHERAAVDTGVLSEVEAERKAAEQESAKLSKHARSVAAASAELAAAKTTFRAAIAAFVGTIPAYAQTLTTEASDTDEAIRAAVTQQADAVATTDAFADGGLATWDAYVAAVVALQADAERVAAEQAERSQYYYWSPSTSTTESTTTESTTTESATTEPSAEPTAETTDPTTSVTP